jgi:lysophospholipase L1-like esterase
MRGLFVAFFALVASCGFTPTPKDGKLPCDHGCPSGYVCRSDNRCWRANAPAVDSGFNGAGGSTIDSPTNTGGTGGNGGADSAGGATTDGAPSATGGTTGATGGTITANGGTAGAIDAATTPTGGTTRDTGGAISTAGATTTRTGGTTATGGIATAGGIAATGGIATTGGTTTVTGGITTKGGTTAATGGTTTASGGAPGTGGAMGTGGSTPPTNTIPVGYPQPTADNAAKCQSVAVSSTACPGQPPSNVCIQCLFGGSTYGTSETTPTADGISEAGNYVVTVTLGGSTAGQTYVSAESSRGLLAPVATAAGQFVNYAFVVNARAMEGQPNHAGGPSGYPGLDLFFSGPATTPPQVSAIGYALAAAATKPVTVYIASDSTVCDQTGGAFGGWGQMLPEYFAPPVAIANYANSGASSSSFYGTSSLWGAITSQWTAGDWVILQFGHNDKTDSDATVQANLQKYVADAQGAGVNAILVSPPARVTTVPVGDQSSLHAAAAQAAATATGVPFIDLTALSSDWYDNVCKTQAVALTYHANGSDFTHTNLAGAEVLAGFVAKAIKTQNIGLAKYLR